MPTYEVETVQNVLQHVLIRIEATSVEIARFRATNGDGAVLKEWTVSNPSDPKRVVRAAPIEPDSNIVRFGR